MDVTTPQSLTPASTATSPDVPSQASSVISSDFETFLKMLTAQAKYQDPLEPIDSSEYAAQLAQFSSVEQQVLTNDLLTAMVDQVNASSMARYSGLIGMEARSTAPANFTGGSITVTPDPSLIAQELTMLVKNTDDEVVKKIPFEDAKEDVVWDGSNDEGNTVPYGLYSFEVESISEGVVFATTPAETYARVQETRVDGAQTLLILSGGVPIATGAATALRQPS